MHIFNIVHPYFDFNYFLIETQVFPVLCVKDVKFCCQHCDISIGICYLKVLLSSKKQYQIDLFKFVCKLLPSVKIES